MASYMYSTAGLWQYVDACDAETEKGYSADSLVFVIELFIVAAKLFHPLPQSPSSFSSSSSSGSLLAFQFD